MNSGATRRVGINIQTYPPSVTLRGAPCLKGEIAPIHNYRILLPSSDKPLFIIVYFLLEPVLKSFCNSLSPS